MHHPSLDSSLKADYMGYALGEENGGVHVQYVCLVNCEEEPFSFVNTPKRSPRVRSVFERAEG